MGLWYAANKTLALIIASILLILILLGSWKWHMRNHDRAITTQCEARVTLTKQAAQLQIDSQIAAYQRQLQDAQHQHETDLAQLAAVRAATPASHLVCHTDSVRANELPTVPGQAPRGAASAGTLPAVRSREFDPGPALDRLHDEADSIVESCRDALKKWPQ